MKVREQRLVDLFIKLVQTDSPSWQEGAMRDLLCQEFASRGLKAWEDDAASVVGGQSGNLLVKIPGNGPGPALLFAAHMDTVQPGSGVQAQVTEGIIRSSGTTILGSDDKAGIAALIEALDVIMETGEQHPPLEFLFTVCEEQGLLGSKAFDFSQLESKIAYVLDAGGAPGSVVVQSPCQNEIAYTVIGKPAHAGINPEDGINAIQVAARALAGMPCGRLDEETTCNFGIIEGGVARNIVPELCRIKGEARSHNREKLDLLTGQLADTFRHQVKEQGARAEVEVKFLYPEIKLDPQEAVVTLAVRAAEDIGLKPALIKTGGGSDASFVHEGGIRCANLGTGMSSVHTCDEFIRIQDLVDNARWVLAIIRAAGKMGGEE